MISRTNSSMLGGNSMSRKHRRNSPTWQWEKALIAAYYDMQYHRVLDPLYEKFQQWKAGKLAHEDIDQAIHEVHKQNQELYSFFTQRHDMLVFMIQRDEEWFFPWLADHPAPPEINIVQPSTFVEDGEEPETEGG